MIARNISSILNHCFALMIIYPSPFDAPSISDTMSAPNVIASVTFIPTNIFGTAFGSITRVNIWNCVAPREVAARIRTGGVFFRPSVMYGSIVINVQYAISPIFDDSPIPNHIIMIGRSAYGGIGPSRLMIGENHASTSF